VESRDPKGLYKKARAGEIKGEPIHFIYIFF
jgi:adenylylsulfate kinase-like enzyme